MRRFRLMIALLASVILLTGLIPTGASAEAISSAGLPRAVITIDGNRLNAEAVNVNGRILAPVRAIFEALGADVAWDAATRTAIGTKGNLVIRITIDQDVAYVGEKAVPLAVPALLVDSRTFVPVRFIGEALGADVKWDGANQTVVITFNAGCTLAGGQEHEGTIADTGETWGLCGSPHIVTGEFKVEGKSSPVLTIEPGAMVRFAAGASIRVGHDAPGGLVAEGTANKPITFTGDMLNPQPGHWEGIYFYDQSIRGKSELVNVKVQYAGSNSWEDGAIRVDGSTRPVEITLNNVTINNSYETGLRLYRQAKLSDRSANLSISGTFAGDSDAGFAISTSLYGSNSLPKGGTFEKNAINGILVQPDGDEYISRNTTWRNLGIPYAMQTTVYVGGAQSPTLTIERGTTTLWAADTELVVGKEGPGTLIADAVTKPEGNGDWKAWNPDTWTLATADTATQLATSARMTGPICSLCGSNQAIVFGAWNAEPTKGFWGGIRFYDQAGTKSVINGGLVAWAGGHTTGDSNRTAGLFAHSWEKPVSIQISNTMVTSSVVGVQMDGAASFKAGSGKNAVTGTTVPLKMSPGAMGSAPDDWNIRDNTNQYVQVWGDENVSASGTWKNLGLPYKFTVNANIGGDSSPVITIAPGTTLIFASETGITVGADETTGSLVAVGQAGKAITFKGATERAGSWNGIRFTSTAGDGNKIEYARIEHATTAVNLEVDLGGFIKNTTIRESAEMGIYRGWGTDGTDFLSGLGNQFEGNAVDINIEE